MYGSPWSAPAWMKSNNALNGQVSHCAYNDFDTSTNTNTEVKTKVGLLAAYMPLYMIHFNEVQGRWVCKRL